MTHTLIVFAELASASGLSRDELEELVEYGVFTPEATYLGVPPFDTVIATTTFVSGVATFSGLTIDEVGSYQLTVNADGLPQITTNTGDDAAAKVTVAGIIDGFGFDTVDIGPLAESWRIQPSTPGYGPRRTAEELRADLRAATHPGGKTAPPG